MDVIHATSKGKMLDTQEKINIYKETRINNQINDKCTVKPNVIFGTLILEDTDRVNITRTSSSAHTSVTSSDRTQTHTSNHPASLNRKYTHTHSHN
jgi:hypothetical protein